MEENNIRMGLTALEAKLISSMASEGKTVFSIAELREKIDYPEKTRKIVSSLVRKKWLERLKNGIYLIIDLTAGNEAKWTEDSYYIASKLADPYYIGFYNMLNYYGWTEQVPSTVVVATTRNLKDRIILGTRYRFVKLSPQNFFGTIKRQIRGREILVSDKEKTVVDSLAYPKYCGGIEEVAKVIYNTRTELDWNKVIEYMEKVNNGALFKRLGYICDLMNISLPDSISKLLYLKKTKGYAYLSPKMEKSGTYNSKWNVLVNTKLTKEKVLA